MIGFVRAKVAAEFAMFDCCGNATVRSGAETELLTLTPLALMTLGEQLHAARNALRAGLGLAEIPTPDLALVVLAFLRRLEGAGACDLCDLVRHFDATVTEIEERRAEGGERARERGSEGASEKAEGAR